jgi:tRNA(Ile)-lysidine synthase
MLERFLTHVRTRGLLNPDRPTLVGYSGGPDSTCLLHLLHRGGFDVIAAHLHHGQREEADKELSMCQAFCDELGVPFLAGRADVPKIASTFKVGLEEAGRMARYQFFESAVVASRADCIATAHTADDHAETMLLNMTRGSGLAGLGGIPERRANIVRPLLLFSREETRAYCEEHGLWTHDDPANFETEFSRVRVRLEVMPALRKINEDVLGAFGRLSEVASAEDEFLDGMAAAALEKSEIAINGKLGFLTRDNEIVFDLGVLCHLPPVLLRRAARLAVSAVGGSLDHRQTEAFISGSGGNGAVTCEGGEVCLEWGDGQLCSRNIARVPGFRAGLTMPGETISDDLGWILSAEEAAMPSGAVSRSSLVGYLNPARLKGDLYFRSWKQGDVMQPLGFSGRRKLSDLLAEANLTANARMRIPLVSDMIGILWIPGVCIDERCRAMPGEKVVRVELRPGS